MSYISGLGAPVCTELEPWARHLPSSLRARCQLLHVDKDEEPVRMLEACTHVYVLCSGRIRTTIRSISGNSFTVDEFEAPTFFGEMELLAGSPHTLGSLVALTPCTFITIPGAAYLAWLQSDLEALSTRSQWVIRSLLRQMGNARSLMGWNSTQRLLFVLFQCCPHAVGSEGALIHATRAELAERAGVSTKTVSRALGELEERGLVHRAGKSIRIEQSAYGHLDEDIRHELESDLPSAG